MINQKRVPSGLEGLDNAIDHFRYGDNVVWEVGDIDDYAFFVCPFIDQSIEDNKNVIYFSFGKHQLLCEPKKGLKIYNIDITKGFETVAMEIYDVIDAEGSESHYIFDSITVLQVEWIADFMMSNFFVVTAPEIRKRNCIAYYAVTRNHHSFESTTRIRESCSVMIETFKGTQHMYLHPHKVFQRYLPSIFLPHRVDRTDKHVITPLTNGIEISRFYEIVSEAGNDDPARTLDNWERFFLEKNKELAAPNDSNVIVPEKDDVITGERFESLRDLCRLVFSTDDRMLDIAIKNITLEDLLEIKGRMIGVGSIGGKATGMLLSRKIVEKKLPEIVKFLEPHDSFYICSNLYYTFLVKNNMWGLKIRQRKKRGYFTVAEILKEKILEGEFSENIREGFRRMLQYYGQSPIIVRSSSLLEDGFGNAFAGKYESVFCVNKGPLEERLLAFENAIKAVYSSTMDESVLEYRLQRGLSMEDEQMGLLIQRVSGSLFKDIYMPAAAGVAFSYNAYRWDPNIDPDAGMIRIVMGLGTRAVDRTDGDYPRIAALDKPELRANVGEYPSTFAQRKIDVLDLSINSISTMKLDDAMDKMTDWFKDIMIERDRKREAEMKAIGRNMKFFYTSCEKIIQNNKFIQNMENIINTIEKEYDYPVDVEFAINFSQEGKYVINLLQCRPLQVGGQGIRTELPDVEKKDAFFKLTGGTMGGSYYSPIDIVIQIDPRGYYEYPYNNKSVIARVVGQINQYYKDKDLVIMLLAPGRIGTTSPELGVPVTFAEISNMSIACEVAFEGGGYMPELSFGSHFFQDLVEADIFYAAIFENKGTTEYFNPDFLEEENNIFDEVVPEPDDPKTRDIIRIYDVQGQDIKLISDVQTGLTVCGEIDMEEDNVVTHNTEQ